MGVYGQGGSNDCLPESGGRSSGTVHDVAYLGLMLDLQSHKLRKRSRLFLVPIRSAKVSPGSSIEMIKGR